MPKNSFSRIDRRNQNLIYRVERVTHTRGAKLFLFGALRAPPEKAKMKEIWKNARLAVGEGQYAWATEEI